MVKQECRQALARLQFDCLHVFAGAGQVPHRLLLAIRDPHMRYTYS